MAGRETAPVTRRAKGTAAAVARVVKGLRKLFIMNLTGAIKNSEDV
jgi:hypothetical protein